MNLGEYQAEIEEELAKMKNGKKKRMLQKMYDKINGKKILKVGKSIDNVNIDDKLEHYNKEVESKTKELE